MVSDSANTLTEVSVKMTGHCQKLEFSNSKPNKLIPINNTEFSFCSEREFGGLGHGWMKLNLGHTFRLDHGFGQGLMMRVRQTLLWANSKSKL